MSPSISALCLAEGYLHPDAQNKGEELAYRADIFATRAFHVLASTAESLAVTTAAVPALGAAMELIYVALLARHAQLRPHGKFQRFLIGLETTRCGVGLGTCATSLASLRGVLLHGTVLVLGSVALGIGVVKDTCEAIQKGSRWLLSRRAGKAARRFALPANSNERACSLVERTRAAFRVKERRLSIKTASYVLMALGQGLALAGLFTFPPLIIAGIALATLGGAIRLTTTVRDQRLLKRQDMAVQAIQELRHIGGLLNESEPLSPGEAERVRQGLHEACAKLSGRDHARIHDALHRNEPFHDVAELLLQRSLDTLGVSYDPETGKSHWNPIVAPAQFAKELADAIESGTPEGQVARRFCASFLDMESLVNEQVPFDRETFLRKMTARLPLGRHVLEYVPRWQKPATGTAGKE